MTEIDEARWDAAAARHDAGMDALAAGDLDEAANAVAEAYAELLDLHGPEHPEVGHVRVSLGMVAAARGDLAAARTDVEAGLAVLDAWDDDAGIPLRVRARSALGDLLRQLGDYDAAVTTLERARDEAAGLDPTDPQVTSVRNGLGIALRFAGRLDAAAEAYAEALAHHDAHSPDDPAGRATILHNVAGLAHARGDVAAGEAAIRAAIALREAAGDAGPGLALDLGLLAALLDEAGRTDDALAVYDRAEAAIEAAFPPDHPERAYVAHNRGDALAAADRWAEAEAAYRVALARKETVFEADHPEAALTRARLAVAVAEQGRHAEAEALAVKALAAARARLPADHPFRRTIEEIAARPPA
jgi:tetratricopeptide (TPR) repeat protein